MEGCQDSRPTDLMFSHLQGLVFNGMKRLFIPAVRLGRNIQADSCAHRRELSRPSFKRKDPAVYGFGPQHLCVQSGWVEGQKVWSKQGVHTQVYYNKSSLFFFFFFSCHDVAVHFQRRSHRCVHGQLFISYLFLLCVCISYFCFQSIMRMLYLSQLGKLFEYIRNL